MIYFLSDAHLGSKAIQGGVEQQRKLVALLDEMSKDAVSIYMLGDMFDFWFEYFMRDSSKRKFSPFFKKVRSLTRKGIHVHYFVGNHDLWTYGGLDSLTGMEIHTEPCTIMRYGKSIFLAHGDGLVPTYLHHHYTMAEKHKIRRFIFLRKMFRRPFLQFCFRLLPPFVGNWLGYGWAARSRQREFDRPCPYKGEDKEELVLYAKEQEKIRHHRDYYIFGHRHIELDLQITPDSRVLILGDTFRQWTYAKLDTRGNISIHTFEGESDK